MKEDRDHRVRDANSMCARNKTVFWRWCPHSCSFTKAAKEQHENGVDGDSSQDEIVSPEVCAYNLGRDRLRDFGYQPQKRSREVLDA
jgi:hypothetical protein